jgi:hypothetical protein
MKLGTYEIPSFVEIRRIISEQCINRDDEIRGLEFTFPTP